MDSVTDQSLFSSTPAPFDVTVEQRDGRVMLRAKGELDLSTVPTLERALAALDDGAPAGVLDLSGVTFMDSSGLRLLIIASERAQAAGRQLSIIPSSAVSLVVDQVGLRATLPLVDA
jgi:anti-sigma B factor antagonist